MVNRDDSVALISVISEPLIVMISYQTIHGTKLSMSCYICIYLYGLYKYNKWPVFWYDSVYICCKLHFMQNEMTNNILDTVIFYIF